MATRTQDKIAKKNIKESHNISSYGTPTVGFGLVYASFSHTAVESVAAGRFDSDGSTVNSAYGISVTKSDTGVYDVTFDEEREDNHYIVNCQLVEEVDSFSKIFVEDGTVTTTGFTILVVHFQSTGQPYIPVDREFFVLVSDIFRKTTETELTQPIVCEDEFGNFQPIIRSTNRDDTKTVRETHGIIRFTDTIDGE